MHSTLVKGRPIFLLGRTSYLYDRYAISRRGVFTFSSWLKLLFEVFTVFAKIEIPTSSLLNLSEVSV